MGILAFVFLSISDELQKILDGITEEVGVYAPRIAAALIILFIGWIIAKLIKGGVRRALRKAALDSRLARAEHLSESEVPSIEASIASGIYYLVMLFVLVGSLNALGLDSITTPTSNTLDKIVTAFPNILAAILVLAIAFVIGRIVSILVSGLLTGVGFDNVPGALGFTWPGGGQTPSMVIGTIILAAFLLFAAMESTALLGFEEMSTLLMDVVVFAGKLVVAFVVIGLAVYVARLVGGIIRGSGAGQAGTLAMAAQVLILFLAGAIALRTLGIANEIIILAFGLPLAAASVAFAIAFGLGGRDMAARQLSRLDGSSDNTKSGASN